MYARLPLALLAAALISCGKPPANTGPKPGTLAEEILLTQKAGYPTTIRNLQAPSPPPHLDAAPLYVQLQSLPPAHVPGTNQLEPSSFISTERMVTKANLAEGRAWLNERKERLAVVKQAAARPQCVFVRNWRDPNPSAVIFPEFASMRQGARLLSIESQVLALESRIDPAIDNLTIGFRLAKHAGEEPVMIAYLVRQAIEHTMLLCAQRLLWLTRGDPAVASRIRNIVEKEWRPQPLNRVVATEGASAVDLMEYYRRAEKEEVQRWLTHTVTPGNLSTYLFGMDEPSWRRFVQENQALTLNRAQRAAAAVDLPYPQARAAFQQLDREHDNLSDDRYLLAKMHYLGPGAPQRRRQSEAYASVMRAACAVLMWRAEHSGRLPVSLEEAIKPALVDPFDGKPLRYRREGSGFVIYSVGAELKFDGGSPQTAPDKRDILFRFPQPAYLTVGVTQDAAERARQVNSVPGAMGSGGARP